ncbi:structural protein [Geobacillus phage vB_GthS_PK2.1]|nr:structural protein [Geobacillus phage vB_GthS_PK2.1]
MARDHIFSFEWEGIDEFIELLDNMDRKTRRIMVQEYTKFGLLVEEGARALAPKDEGNLEDTINAEKARIIDEGVEVEVGVGSVYGLRRHEEPPRMGKYPKYERGAKFPNYYINGLGARTRSKPGWRGEKPGRKYLQRAVELVVDDFVEMNERILQRIMEGRR